MLRRKNFARLLAASLLGPVLLAQSASAGNPLGDRIKQMPANSWARVNTNQFNQVWPDLAQRPAPNLGRGSTGPSMVIDAWGGAAWDSNRGDLIIFGGQGTSSCCMPGNEVYRWRSTTLEWERASLPSALRWGGENNTQPFAIDGPEYAPMGGESFDALEFLPGMDRLAVFGLAVNGYYKHNDTGPFFWDPAKADPTRVGGTTGSHVNPGLFPGVLGGYMWENRDNPAVLRPELENFNVTARTEVDGKDAVFVASKRGGYLHRYIASPEGREHDAWEVVGYYNLGWPDAGTMAFDPQRNVLVANRGQLAFWDMSQPGPSNRAKLLNFQAVGQEPLDPELPLMGLVHDPLRDRFLFWKGNRELYQLKVPDQLESGTWTMEAIVPPGNAPVLAPFTSWGGVFSKFQYMPAFDAFIGVTNGTTGDIWVYKPEAAPGSIAMELGKVDVSHEWSGVGFVEPLGASPVVITAMQSLLGYNPTGIRMKLVDGSGFDVRLEEEQSADPETWHLPESVGYLGLAPGDLVNVDGDVIGEAARFTTAATTPGYWQTVALGRNYSNPVIVASVGSFTGAQPVHSRIRNIQSNSFEVLIEEWDYLDGWHTPEDLHYLVVEAGRHQLPDGRFMEARVVNAGRYAQWFSFGQAFFDPPVVLAHCNSDNDADAVVTRLGNISASGFAVSLQEEEAGDQIHPTESIGVIAVGY